MDDKPKKDAQLIKRCKVFGEQLKPMAAAMLKTYIDLHNHSVKMEELSKGMVKALKEFPDSEIDSIELVKKVGRGVGLICLAQNATARAGATYEGALKQIEEWARDIQRLDDPKTEFKLPGAQSGKIITPDKRVVQPSKKIIIPGQKKGGGK